MDIVILANYTYDFSSLDNGRFKYIADILSSGGDDVEIITSDFFHITKKHREKINNNVKYKITYIHEPGYSKNVCLKRFYSHKVWGDNIKKYLNNRKKPDVIYSAVPSLEGPYFAGKYCKKNNIRFVIDVQDLWPEAFKMVFNIPIISNVVFAPFNMLANKIYSNANAICAVSKTYCERAKKANSTCDNIVPVFLGTELKRFDSCSKSECIIEKNKDEIWLAYCGTLGSSYDITVVLDALKLLKDDRLKFIIMGDGPKMDEFKKYAQSLQVNALFLGRLNYEKMCSVLTKCDITVNPIAHNAAQSIINKHADYAASGLPVVNTQECIEYRQLVDEYKMGINCNNNDPSDIANRLLYLINNYDIRVEMGKNARKCAEELFDRAVTYKKLIDVIKFSDKEK